MSEAPTLIILAESEGHPMLVPSALAPHSATPESLDTLHQTIRKGLMSGLQVLLVAPPMVAAQTHHLLHPSQVILLPDHPSPTAESSSDPMALGVAIAVIASARSPGWLLLPGDMPLLKVDTLKLMGQAVTHDPLVYPEYRHRRGHPIGFSAEFYSALSRLQRERDLQRLLAQYPARGIDVDDAGILMTQDTQSHLALLRTVLQGNAGLSTYL